MGAKPSRQDVAGIAVKLPKMRGLSREDLAGCVASLASMAHTGINTELPEIRVNDCSSGRSAGFPSSSGSTGIPPEALRALRGHMQSRLHRQVADNDDPEMAEEIEKQLMESLQNSDDSTDWASMRAWLVWCLHEQLDDEEDHRNPNAIESPAPPDVKTRTRGKLTRQTKVDIARSGSYSRYEGGRDGGSNGKLMPGGSSGESSANSSAQSSFDS